MLMYVTELSRNLPKTLAYPCPVDPCSILVNSLYMPADFLVTIIFFTFSALSRYSFALDVKYSAL